MSDNHPPKRQKRVEEKYDVFISFRGEIRRGFLSHLVANLKRENINVFIDYRLKRGDEIEPSLVEAIEGSFILLIIFSPHYASSPWCLEELVTILECKEKFGRIVIPVFYDIEPTHVWHQSSDSYKNAFAQHQIEYDDAKVQSWRYALNKSANLSGFESSKFKDDAELVKILVSQVNLELTSLAKSPVNSKILVGIDEKIADMVSLIRKEPNDTCLIGIWGMGGLGKTTLAKEVFNKLQFEYAGSYFLADEKDQSDKNGIISLKKIIFSKLLGYDVEIDMPDYLPEHIVRKIGRMKVLIVLDNVNDPVHIQNLLGNLTNFGSGSTIIVTTRNEQVLKTNNAKKYQLAELSSDEALELFSLNAFNQSDHQREYDGLSKRVVRYAHGIPLVLEVLASHLCGNNQDQWESELDKLEKMPNRTVYDKMMWSYKDLDPKQQQIFLDLACFFVRSYHAINVGDLKFLLKDSERDNSVVANLGRLKSKTLITISEDNFVYIHDSLQEMAREIVCEESIGDPGGRSRLWDPDDIYEVLKTGKVTEAIRSIQIHLPTIVEHKLISHIIPKMSRLQFLEIHGKCDDDCFDQLHILAEGLQFLSTKLRFLYWYGYPLKSLPENFSAERLVILSLQNGKMEKLWDEVKNLVNLKEVDLSWSHMLKELPDLSKATSLKVLVLRHCFKLISLHPSIFSLPNLENLDLEWCTSLSILTNYSQSRSLKYLNCEKCRNPMEFSVISENQTQLLHHDISYCTELPLSPKYLEATRCTSLQTLPDLPLTPETQNIISRTSLQTLPKLPQSLKILLATNCASLQTLPDLPQSLEVLNVRSCPLLQTLPKLPQSLKMLEATHCTSLQTLPDLPQSLEVLNVTFCTSIQNLPKLPQSLTTLEATDCTFLQTLPDLLLSHEALNVENYASLQTLPKLPQSLIALEATRCTSLQTLSDLPLSLEVLNVRFCTSLQTLPKLPKSLKTLKVAGCTSLQTLPDLSLSLEALFVENCTSLQTLPKLPKSLKTLEATDCPFLQTLPDFPMSLEVLNVRFCASIQTLPKLPQSLRTLEAIHCNSLQTLPDLPLSLEALYVENITSLQILPKLPQSLKTLEAIHCTSLQTLPDLPLSLEALNVENCISLQTLLGHVPFLKFLNARKCESLKTVSLFPSKAVEQLKENRKQVLLGDCINLVEDSLVAIGLNAQINVMKFASQCPSTQDRDFYFRTYGAVYVYPGRSVPEWFEYKTTKNHITIDHFSTLPSAQCGFIFCFIIGMYKDRYMCTRIAVNLIISDGDGEGDKDSVTLRDWLYPSFVSDHVCVMSDQKCSDFLNARTKNQRSFKIQVTIKEAHTSKELPQQALKGIGVSRISSSACNSFIQQLELPNNHSIYQFH